MTPMSQLKWKKAQSLWQILSTVGGFRISKNDRHTVKCVGLLFFSVQNLEMLLSRNASSAVFHCYLMLREKKKIKLSKKRNCPFPILRKPFIKLWVALWSILCVLGSYLNLQTRVCFQFLGSRSCKRACLTYCSHVALICSFQSFLI